MAPLIEGRVLALLLLAPLTPMQRIAWNLSPCAVSVSLVYVHLVRRNVTIGVVVLALSGLWATGTGLAVSPAAKRPCAKPMVGKSDWGGHGKDCGRERGTGAGAHGESPEIGAWGVTVAPLRENAITAGCN